VSRPAYALVYLLPELPHFSGFSARERRNCRVGGCGVCAVLRNARFDTWAVWLGT